MTQTLQPSRLIDGERADVARPGQSTSMADQDDLQRGGLDRHTQPPGMNCCESR